MSEEEEELMEQALKCDPETETAQMIEDAGYDTKPSTEAVDESLYCDLLMDSLNEQAGVAHVDSIHGVGDGIEVTFSLPFGGSFTHQYERPEKRSHKNPSIKELFSVTDGSLDNLTGAIDRPVYIRKDSHDSWDVDHTTRPSFTEDTTLETQEARNHLRRRLAATVGGTALAVGAFSLLLRFGQVTVWETIFVGTVIALLISLLTVVTINYNYMRRAARVMPDD